MDPEWQGSCYKDTHIKDPQFLETANCSMDIWEFQHQRAGNDVRTRAVTIITLGSGDDIEAPTIS